MPVLRELKDEIDVSTLAALQNSHRFRHSQTQTQSNYKCDECNMDITGFRYNCLTCPDFDLCSICVSAADADGGHHDHPMIRSSEQEPALGFEYQRFVLKRIKEIVKTD